MSELKIGDMVIVIHRDGAKYSEGCGPGTTGEIKRQCLCLEATFEMIHGGFPVVQLKTAKGGTFCITVNLLRKIEPPGEECGSWSDIGKACDWNPTKEMEHA